KMLQSRKRLRIQPTPKTHRCLQSNLEPLSVQQTSKDVTHLRSAIHEFRKRSYRRLSREIGLSISCPFCDDWYRVWILQFGVSIEYSRSDDFIERVFSQGSLQDFEGLGRTSLPKTSGSFCFNVIARISVLDYFD